MLLLLLLFYRSALPTCFIFSNNKYRLRGRIPKILKPCLWFQNSIMKLLRQVVHEILAIIKYHKILILKTFKYVSLLITNQVKTNINLVSVKLFAVRSILCATLQTSTTITIITTRSLLFSAYNHFASNTYWLFLSHNLSLFYLYP